MFLSLISSDESSQNLRNRTKSRSKIKPIMQNGRENGSSPSCCWQILMAPTKNAHVQRETTPCQNPYYNIGTTVTGISFTFKHGRFLLPRV